MKLHLGCGQRRLEGYLNIDFPPSEHTVMEVTAADEFHDITRLKYAAESVDEVRLHHVFEHFPRPVACALLAGWNSWLKPNGVIHIEVPDFERTARVMLRQFTSDSKRATAERHIFGSQEAGWAYHYAGYTRKSLRQQLELYGFSISSVKGNQWKGTFNIEIIARKECRLTCETAEIKASQWLKRSLVDESESELKLLEVWMSAYRLQIDSVWASDE